MVTPLFPPLLMSPVYRLRKNRPRLPPKTTLFVIAAKAGVPLFSGGLDFRNLLSIVMR